MAFWRPKASSMENQCAPKSTTLHAGAHLFVRYRQHWLLSVYARSVASQLSCLRRERWSQAVASTATQGARDGAREHGVAIQRALGDERGRVGGEQDVVRPHRRLCDGDQVAQVGLVRPDEPKLVLDLHRTSQARRPTPGSKACTQGALARCASSSSLAPDAHLGRDDRPTCNRMHTPC